ncbi:MAG: hypothetical protein E6Q83_16445 [Thiothrix sp.]|nr:MAG: hypothetical protein E6Q83_16445 [Thiothrix sp.]
MNVSNTLPLDTANASRANRLNEILGHAYQLAAISKTINLWAAEEPVRDNPSLMLDSSDIVTLSGMAQASAQAIVELADVAGGKA